MVVTMTDWEEAEKGRYPKTFVVNLLLFWRKLMKHFSISMNCIIKHASLTILQRVTFF